jgi:hypothetical protein
MNQARDDLLTDTALTGDQHLRAAAGRVADFFLDGA